MYIYFIARKHTSCQNLVQMLSAQLCEVKGELEAEKGECLSKLENITSGMYTAYPSLYDNCMHVTTV